MAMYHSAGILPGGMYSTHHSFGNPGTSNFSSQHSCNVTYVSNLVERGKYKPPPEEKLEKAAGGLVEGYAPIAASAAFNRVLRQSVAALSQLHGFDGVQPSVLETLTHIASSYITEACQSARAFTEATGRTATVPSDIWLGLIGMGHDVEALEEYLSHLQSIEVPFIHPPKVQPPQPTLTPLHVGRSRVHYPHINDFLPPFPDPHTFVRTEISIEPDQSYERARHQQAQRKRAAEISLTEVMLRTHSNVCLFPQQERRMREESLTMIAARKQRVLARKLAQKKKETAESEESLKELPEDLMADESMASQTEKPSEGTQEEEEEDEEFFEPPDTVASIMRKRIPSFLFVLEPSEERCPHLATLRADCNVEEEEKSRAAIGGKARALGESAREGASLHENIDERVVDNPYLRPPRQCS